MFWKKDLYFFKYFYLDFIIRRVVGNFDSPHWYFKPKMFTIFKNLKYNINIFFSANI